MLLLSEGVIAPGLGITVVDKLDGTSGTSRVVVSYHAICLLATLFLLPLACVLH